MNNNRLENIGGGVLLVTIAACFGLIVLLIYNAVQDSYRETFTLKKDEWKCTQQSVESTVVFAPVVGGKGTGFAAVPSTTVVCVEYRKEAK